ncbi:hypothetical protein BH10BAC4_BH10BAC4_09910 [soil metagenome]
MSEKSEQPQSLTLLDLDRTILNTDLYAETLDGFLMEKHKKLALSISEARKRVEAENKTFDSYDHILQEIGQADADEIDEEFIAFAHSNGVGETLYNPGFKELLAWLEWRKSAFAIFTSGSVAGQTTKIRSMKLDKYPYSITTLGEKGNKLQEWRQADGTFRIPLTSLMGDVAVFSKTIADKDAVFANIRTLDDRYDAYVGAPDADKGVTQYIYRKPGSTPSVVQERGKDTFATEITDPIIFGDLIAEKLIEEEKHRSTS